MLPNYDLLVRQAKQLLEGESDLIANAANFAAFVYHKVPDLNWAGFYFRDPNGELRLGPFQGQPACSRLPKGGGVCGVAVGERRTVVVDNVLSYAEHIACDSASRSEIVVPILDGDEVLAVFDVDSPEFSRFTPRDREGIERLVEAFVASVVLSS